MLTKTNLFVDNLRHRDHYLRTLRDRMRFYMDTPSANGSRVIDNSSEYQAPATYTVPEIAASDLAVEPLVNAMREHGCLLVRGFFNARQVEGLRAYIDYAFALHRSDTRLSRYLRKRLDLSEMSRKIKSDIEEKRKANPTYSDTVKASRNLGQPFAANGSYLVPQTPIVAERILQLYADRGLKSLLSEYFGNPPCASIYKWVMRRSGPPENPLDFHQDGAFMGDDIASLNTWVPLSDCGPGQGAHGLDLVPARLLQSYAKGSGLLDWSASAQRVQERFGDAGIVSPRFRAGDLLFFDHLLLHRSQHLPEFNEPRYALETWFFDSVNFPKNQIPLRW